ncbi:MAG: hypothetical protein JWO15_113 [Sphingomonadales bacterium]|nr:hypothetical protein [Sphingomonadales bacterium]
MTTPRKLCAIVLFIGLSVRLSAQTPPVKEDLSDQIITGAWGDPTKCNLTNASPVLFADAARDGGAVSGACVSITAYWKGGAVYANKADAELAKSVVTSRLRGRRVGIYADERTFVTAPRHPTPFTVVGTYASCKTEWPGAMMVLGYCHFSDGPFLKVSQTQSARRRDVR